MGSAQSVGHAHPAQPRATNPGVSFFKNILGFSSCVSVDASKVFFPAYYILLLVDTDTVDNVEYR